MANKPYVPKNPKKQPPDLFDTAFGYSGGSCKKHNYSVYIVKGEEMKFPNNENQAFREAQLAARELKDYDITYDIMFSDGRKYYTKTYKDLNNPREANKYQKDMRKYYNKNYYNRVTKGNSKYRKIEGLEGTVVRKDERRQIKYPKKVRDVEFAWDCVKMGNIVFIKKYYKKPKRESRRRKKEKSLHTESCAPIELDYKVCFCINKAKHNAIMTAINLKTAKGLIVHPSNEGRILESVEDVETLHFVKAEAKAPQLAKKRQKKTGEKYRIIWVEDCPSG